MRRFRSTKLCHSSTKIQVLSAVRPPKPRPLVSMAWDDTNCRNQSQNSTDQRQSNCIAVAGGGGGKDKGAACLDCINLGRCNKRSTCCTAASDQAPKRPTRESRRPRCTLQIIAATCFLRMGSLLSWTGTWPSKILFAKVWSAGTGCEGGSPCPQAGYPTLESPWFQHKCRSRYCCCKQRWLDAALR